MESVRENCIPIWIVATKCSYSDHMLNIWSKFSAADKGVMVTWQCAQQRATRPAHYSCHVTAAVLAWAAHQSYSAPSLQAPSAVFP